MNITTSIIDLGAGLDEHGNLAVVNFTVLASAESGETVRYDVSQMGGSYPQPANPRIDGQGGYTQDELLAIADSIAIAKNAYGLATARLESMLIVPVVPAPPPVHVPTDAERKKALADQIDSYVAYVYSRYTRFQMEYELREAAANAFKAAGYAGQPDDLITRFATNTGMTLPAATDLILAQSANLRGAVKSLGNLRMDKYLVLNAATFEAAQASFDATMAAIGVIDRSLA